MELCLELSLSSFCAVYIVLLRQCYVAMPSGYKLVITRALGMHGIYCTQPSGLTPSCFSAIYSIHPLCPCYNYNIFYSNSNNISGKVHITSLSLCPNVLRTGFMYVRYRRCVSVIIVDRKYCLLKLIRLHYIICN